MEIRSPFPRDRKNLEQLLAPTTGNPFRPDEVSCALELLESVLDPPPGNTYEARVMVDSEDCPVAYACFGATPMTDGTFDIY